MRIVNLAEFRALPAGTLYIDYHDTHGIYDGALRRKGNTLECDFYTSTVCTELDVDDSNDEDYMLGMAEGDSSIGLPLHFDTSCRDGLYEKDKRFAVYEAKDVKGLLDIITSSYNVVSGGND